MSGMRVTVVRQAAGSAGCAGLLYPAKQPARPAAQACCIPPSIRLGRLEGLLYPARMSRNGKQQPQRPRIEVAQASASPEEAAAIAAAIEQSLRDTAPPPESDGP